MTDFSVGPEGLQTLRAALTRGGEHLTRARTGLDALADADLGATTLTDAVRSLRQRRTDGLTDLQDCLTSLDGHLAATQQDYAETEQALRRQFTPTAGDR
ncbi:hypothetical protein [Pseudonocardia sp. HH130630-07]|uniref:hypothetical protein n=1 Tax=Pseudonocardia sp. HH130630-07 TaxID=1690815 RepID=UPI000814DDA9|nr:hypothetical protein [Pseudonocardia sp. HH130630-07]ANY06634.1 hypothetical protein AFB00_10385 [Pseudonocardia sp. HH130630-07]